MAQSDYYAVLGVPRGAGVDEIKKAYRKLARKHHPDVNAGNKRSEERFKEISAAFDVLSDPEKKKLYDEFGDEGLRPGFNAEQARAFKQWHHAGGRGGFGGGAGAGAGADGFADLFGGGFDLSDLFGGASPFGGAARSRRGQDARAALTIELRDAVLGAERELTFERTVPCDECQGSGQRGRGRCSRCGGAGQQGKTVRLNVKIPAGIADGHTMRLAGQGMPGGAGAAPGDLLLDITVAPHPFLERRGQDLYLTLPVTLREAMLGARVEVPTFQGKINLTLPAGSQNGEKLRVRGRGVGGKEGGGDLYVVLDVRLPTTGADRPSVRSAVAELDQLYTDDVRAGLRL